MAVIDGLEITWNAGHAQGGFLGEICLPAPISPVVFARKKADTSGPQMIDPWAPAVPLVPGLFKSATYRIKLPTQYFRTRSVGHMVLKKENMKRVLSVFEDSQKGRGHKEHSPLSCIKSCRGPRHSGWNGRGVERTENMGIFTNYTRFSDLRES